MKYIIALGSNLKPQRHIPAVLQLMLIEFSMLRTGHFFRTRGYYMSSAHRFWNGAVMIETSMTQALLKQTLCLWETRSGRDRSHPKCSTRDRTLDLDIVWSEEMGWLDDIQDLKQRSYLWQPILPLLSARGRKRGGLIPVWFQVGGELLGGRSRQLK